MSELFVYSEEEEDWENINNNTIKNNCSSYDLLIYYVNKPKELEIDATKYNLTCENYLYQIFLEASKESKK